MIAAMTTMKMSLRTYQRKAPKTQSGIAAAQRATSNQPDSSTFRIAYRSGKFDKPSVMPQYYQPEDWVISTWWRKP